MKNRFIFCFCIAAFVSFIAYGQDSSQQHKNLFNFGLGGNFGVAKLSSKNLNHSLKEQNLPAALNKLPFYYEVNIFFDPITPETKFTYHLVLGFAMQQSDEGNIHLDADAINYGYDFDYMAWHHNRQYFFPSIGFGWLTYKYSFIDKNNYPSSYSEALQNFTGERTIRSGALFYLNVEANYSYALDKTDNFLLGIHAGYNVGLNSKTMQLSDGYSLNESPKVKANSFNAAVSLIIQ
jgi:hypothetical protein